jgi:hypothetical protein
MPVSPQLDLIARPPDAKRRCVAGAWPGPPDRILPAVLPEIRDMVRTLGLVALISGGQTGVDRAALDVAVALGVPAGGWAPRGWAAEDGLVPLRYRALLSECREPGEPYATRTRANVLAADLVLLVVPAEGGGPGTRLTERLAADLDRPVLRLVERYETRRREPRAERAQKIRTWIRGLSRPDGLVLMVAGPRVSRWPSGPEQTEKLLRDVLGAS